MKYCKFECNEECGLYYMTNRLVYRESSYVHKENKMPDVNISFAKDGYMEIDRLLKICTACKKGENTKMEIKKEGVAYEVILAHSLHPADILQHKAKQPSVIVFFPSLNDVRHINTLFSHANYCLEIDERFICHCTATDSRQGKILKRYPRGINYLMVLFDFCWSRVIPKMPLLKDIYYRITKSKNRALHRVAVLGKLYRSGFEVTYEEVIRGELYIIASKCKEPIKEDNPNTGLLIRLKRIGKNEKVIKVYKFRTMHAYSEYLQSYVYESSTLVKGDKINNDYRVTAWGKFMRKYWIDELPQLINLIKGDIKLVGVRPLSQHKFSLYDEKLQALRIKTKPGLIPPYYADMPESLEELENSEKRYLEAYMKNPFLTDCRYFWKVFKNIVFKGVRSR